MSDEAKIPNAIEQAAILRKQAELLEVEHRVVEAVARYGRKIEPSMPLLEAYSIISACLEEGAAAIEAARASTELVKG